MHEFAIGKLNVLEKRIFDKLDQERMLKAADFEKAFEVLYDTDLGEAITSQKDIEKILEEDSIALKKTFSSLLNNDERLVSCLFLKFDASNLKLCLKKYQEQQEPSSKSGIQLPFIDWSAESPEKLEKWVSALLKQGLAKKNKVDFSHLPHLNFWVKKLIILSLGKIKNMDSYEIEISVDMAYLKVKLQISDKISSFLRELVKMEIDILNLKNQLRFENDREKRRFFIQKGNFTYEEMVRIAKLKEAEPLENLKEFLEEYKFSRILRNYKKRKSLMLFEKECHNLISDEIFKKSRETGLGIEKILSYFQKKFNAQHNIRLILFSKSNNITIEEIEPQLLLI